MIHFSVTDEIQCCEERFWQLFLDRQFIEAHYLDGLRFLEFQVLDQRDTPQGTERKVTAMPNVQLPKAVAKLFGSGFRYVETGAFDKASRLWTYKAVPNGLGDKIRHEGSIRTEPLGAERLRRTVDVVVEARILGLGGMMETMAERTLRDGWHASARFTNRWLEARPPQA